MDEFEEIAAGLTDAELSTLLVKLGGWFNLHGMEANRAAVNEAAWRLARES